MNTKYLIFVIIYLICVKHLYSQESTSEMAYAAPNGIFVYMNLEIPFTNSKYAEPFRYKIERRSNDKTVWESIDELSAPNDYTDFINRLKKINLTLLDSIPLSTLPLEIIWKKVNQFESFDSLRYLGNPLNIRMALGVLYFDKTPKENVEYQYRVSKVTNNSIDELFITNQTVYPGIFKNESIIVDEIESTAEQITVNWLTEPFTQATRFKVYRRTNFENSFVEILPVMIVKNNQDKVLCTIIDTSVTKNELYEYYILPIDYYQNRGSQSEIATIPAYDYNKVFPPYDFNVEDIDTIGALKLSWKQKQSNGLTSIKIFRSNSYDNGFIEIGEVGSHDSVFIDRSAEPMVNYYYYLKLNDPFNKLNIQSVKSFGLYKSYQSPFPPVFVQGVGTDVGVQLSWLRPSEDAIEYQIFRNNGFTDSLEIITKIASSDSIISFTDSSDILRGDKLYAYSIKSVNSSSLVSVNSDTVFVKPNKPVIIPPPLNLEGTTYNSTVYLYWQDMFKTISTIDGYIIYRRVIKDEKTLTPLVDTLLNAKQNNFIDSLVTFGHEYQYSIQALDIYGNKSPLSSSITIKINPKLILPPAGVNLQSVEGGIKISWNKSLQENISGYKIFRYQRGVKEALIVTVNNTSELNFIDKNVKRGELYFYYLIAVDIQNNESLPSKDLGIRF